MSKVKEIDKFFMFQAERMNEIEWRGNQCLWRKLLMMEKEMPERFRVHRSKPKMEKRK